MLAVFLNDEQQKGNVKSFYFSLSYTALIRKTAYSFSIGYYDSKICIFQRFKSGRLLIASSFNLSTALT